MKMYSKKAIPQLSKMTFQIGINVPPASLLYFKCPYQAKVMNTLEMTRRSMGTMRDCVKVSIETNPIKSSEREYGAAPETVLRRLWCARQNEKCLRPARHPLCPAPTRQPCV